jgi:DGQHR domain-containing protein
LVGEITARSDSKRLRAKYEKYIQHLNLLRLAGFSDGTWRRIGVPEDRLREFRKIREIRGFFIATRLSIYEAPLKAHANVARLYRDDWILLESYVNAIGSFARYPFLATFELGGLPGQAALLFRQQSHKLVYTSGRSIAQGVGPADVFTFETSPYLILPLARVLRRDLLPDLGDQSASHYQRPLIPEKLNGIRRKLLCDRDFMFPVSILVVLSPECSFDPTTGTLMIPAEFGTMAVIDGQHRLFSYADEELKAKIEADAKLMVTAVRFRDMEADEVLRASARMFVEINTNQTRVVDAHLDAIAFPVLGEASPRALGAQVLVRTNNRTGSPVYGLFQVEGSKNGVPAEPVLRHLGRLVNRRWLGRAAQWLTREDATEGDRERYASMCDLYAVENLAELQEPRVLVEKATIVYSRFLTDVSRVFRHDWPGAAEHRQAWFGEGNVLGAVTRLLVRMVAEGNRWQTVSRSLELLREHLVEGCGLTTYDRPLLDPARHTQIPTPQETVTVLYRFLAANRIAPTAGAAVGAQR